MPNAGATAAVSEVAPQLDPQMSVTSAEVDEPLPAPPPGQRLETSDPMVLSSSLSYLPPSSMCAGGTAGTLSSGRICQKLKSWASDRRVIGAALLVAVAAIATNATTGPRPTLVAPTASNAAALVQRICADLPGTCADLSAEGTPQSEALAWVAADANFGDIPEWRRVQRYTLAVVAFGLEGWGSDGIADWKDGPEDECSWVWGYADSDVGCNAAGRVTQIGFVQYLNGGKVPRDLALLADSLEKLYFGRGEFNGTIPTELCLLSKLTYLDLSSNELSGSIPSEVGLLTKMEELYLSYNKLMGAIPTEMGALTNLEELHAESNELSGPIPSELGLLTKLDHARLDHNDLTGVMPEEVCRLRKPAGPTENLWADCEEVQCNCCTICCVDDVDWNCTEV